METWGVTSPIYLTNSLLTISEEPQDQGLICNSLVTKDCPRELIQEWPLIKIKDGVFFLFTTSSSATRQRWFSIPFHDNALWSIQTKQSVHLTLSYNDCWFWKLILCGFVNTEKRNQKICKQKALNNQE